MAHVPKPRFGWHGTVTSSAITFVVGDRVTLPLLTVHVSGSTARTVQNPTGTVVYVVKPGITAPGKQLLPPNDQYITVDWDHNLGHSIHSAKDLHHV